MGFMQCQSLGMSEIVTETSTEPSHISLDEDNDTEESRVECKMEDPDTDRKRKIENCKKPKATISTTPPEPSNK